MKSSLIKVIPNEVIFPKTYIFSRSNYTIELRNESSQTVNYRWSKYASLEEENGKQSSLDMLDQKNRNEIQIQNENLSEYFKVFPNCGEIWPNRTQIITFEFCPHVADVYTENMYLDVYTEGDRECVKLKGSGLPPDAFFTVETVNIGPIPLDSVCEYEVFLKNTGKVAVDYSLKKRSLEGYLFSFSPESGHIDVGSQQRILAKFIAGAVGQFNESFQFLVKGSVQFHPSISFYGKVLGPEVFLSSKVISFGDVSHGFLYSGKFEIENKSSIPFDYVLRLDQNNSFSPREFSISPSSGTIQKFARQIITIEFVPISIQRYSVNLFLDVGKVGKALEIIQISANCICPQLEVESSTIDFGKVFITHKALSKLSISNNSDFPSKYELFVSDKSSINQATVTVRKSRGVIGPHQESSVEIELIPLILGPISITGYLRSIGSDNPPIPWIANAICTGPTIQLSHNSINFGTIPVLNDSQQKLLISNTSFVLTSFSITIQSDNTSFRVDQKDGTLEPGASASITVIANLDDSIAFSGKLMITIQHLNPIYVDLIATGSGTPIIPSINLSSIDFGYILNEIPSKQQFSLVNHGRRPQDIRWSIQKPKIDDNASKVFRVSINPEQSIIEPHGTAVFTLSVDCPIPTSFSFQMTCHSSNGRHRSDLFQPVVKGIIMRPLLWFSQPNVEFWHVHDTEKEELMDNTYPTPDLLPSQTHTVTVKNIVQITLNVVVETFSPFEATPSLFSLKPGESIDLNVLFIAGLKKDFASEQILRKIHFTFESHPYVQFINLKTSYIFPNLSFLPENSIQFGNLLINTEQTKEVTIQSTSNTDVEWLWQLIPSSDSYEVEKVFDVFPIRGSLKPFEKDSVHFSFFAISGQDGKSSSYQAHAICHIKGGPDYSLSLNGSAAAIMYRIDPTSIDFGIVRYDSTLTKQIVLTNLSDVAISFSSKIPKNSRFSTFTTSPMDGIIPVGGIVILNLQIQCGFPRDFNESFTVQIGHFEEIKIPVSAQSYFPQLHFSLSRANDDPSQCNHLVNNPNELSQLEKDYITSRISDRQLSMTTGVSRKKKNINDDSYTGIIYAKYLLNAGDIIIGETKTFDIKIESLSPFPLNFYLKQNILKGTGFYFEPSQFEDVPAMSNLSLQAFFDTSKRTNGSIGDVKYTVLCELSEDLGISIEIKANILLPSLKLSKTHCDFESVIVGQVKTLTIQLQNMQPVSCEFAFGIASQLGIPPTSSTLSNKKALSANSSQNENEDPPDSYVFKPNPSNGVLPPASFQNVEISFMPLVGKTYTMQMPLVIKHNTQPKYVTFNGVGEQLRIEFEPQNISVAPVLPFSEPSISEFSIFNPTPYPVEVFSYHFDYTLFADSVLKHSTTPILENVTFSQSKTVSKFSICVIVHGSHMSGKSFVSECISRHLNSPILKLNEIWKTLIEQKDTPPAADFTAKFFERISEQDCSDGFIVDGLDCFSEPSETEHFLTQCLKQKSCLEDAIKNPFQPVPHNAPTASELALQYILDSLDGHYVFLVGVQANISIINQRIDKAKSDERKKRKTELQKEKESLFNMTEAEYENLTQEEKDDIDLKRKNFRKRLVKTQEPESSTPSHRSKHHKKDEKIEEKKDDKGKKRGKSILPTDPTELNLITYNLTIGSLNARLKDTRDRFQSLDPKTIIKNLNYPLSKEQQYSSSINAVLIESNLEVGIINEIIAAFIPKINQIKESAFTSLIPAPRIEISSDLDYPKSKYEEAPSFFSIVNNDPFPEISLEGTVTPNKSNRQSRKNNKDSSKSPESAESLLGQIDTSRLTNRWRIPPISRQKISIRFTPTAIGSYKFDFLFGISNCKSLQFKLPVNGVCSHPSLERMTKNMFTKKFIKGEQKSESGFSIESNEYIFGSVLVSKERLPRGVTPSVHDTLKLTNISQFPAEITCIFSDNGPKAMWTIDPQTQIIQPNSSCDFIVGVHPLVPELLKTLLTIFIKDQPDPIFISFTAEGCVPSIDLSSQSFEFDKLLLDQSRTLSIDIKNSSKLISAWRLKGLQTIGNCFNLNATEGIINQKGSFVLKVGFSSAKPLTVKKSIQLEVLDKDKNRVFSTIPIQINAESFDVIVDFQYPKGIDHLVFGSLKVGQPKQLICTLKNKGKYPVQYRIIFDNPSIASLFQIQPQEGLLPQSDKIINLSFTFKTPRVLSFANSKGIKLMVIDPNTQTTTAQIPLPFSVDTMYSQFSIIPNKKVLFGILPVGISMAKSITLKNEGRFPFEFEVYSIAEDNALNSGNKNKKNVPPKPKAKKAGPHLQIGPYSIGPSNGSIPPQGSTNIDIEFSSPTPGDFQTAFGFKITDHDPAAKEDSFIFTTSAQSIIPGIEIQKFEKIFPGTHLCLRYDIQRVNKTAFLEDEQVLHFEPIILQRRASVDVSIINLYPVATTVDLSIKPPKAKPGTTYPFEINEKIVNLEPLESKKVVISFVPVICESFIGQFEATVRGGSGDNRLLKFGIEGIGSLPTITIDGGMEHLKNGQFSSNFGKVLLGFSKEKAIKLVNESFIPAKVFTTTKPCPDFEIMDSEQFTSFTIPPQSSESIIVLFKPSKPRKGQFEVNFSVADNPKSGLSLVFIGEGNSEDLIFEGLSNDEGDLIFKDCIVGRQQQNVFIMRNIGQNDVRFVWTPASDISFSPKIGHLRMNQSKSIVATFFSDHPVKPGSVKASCQITKMELSDPSSPDWDDSMKIVKFITKKVLQKEHSFDHIEEPKPKSNLKEKQTPKKVKIVIPPEEEHYHEETIRTIETKPEPPSILAQGKPKEIPLRVFIVADNIRYQLDTSEITFSPTMMYQTRFTECRIINTCQIRFEFTWHVMNFEALRSGNNHISESPFSVSPRNGFIEPGQTQVFRVMFSPQEVDDYSAKLFCEIPFLSGIDPPFINVSAFSRRPFCHFNVDTSDYLTRRHPDYTVKLPTDIKVIELNSKGVEVSITKKIELINPTSSPYEAVWQYIGEGPTPFECGNPKGLISSGKKAWVTFTFTPVSVKTIESNWEFLIPEHNLRVPFLFVGRIVPN